MRIRRETFASKPPVRPLQRAVSSTRTKSDPNEVSAGAFATGAGAQSRKRRMVATVRDYPSRGFLTPLPDRSE